MKITQTAVAFHPMTIAIEIESLAELETLRRLTRFDHTIPELLRGGSGHTTPNATPDQREQIARTFLRTLEKALESK